MSEGEKKVRNRKEQRLARARAAEKGIRYTTALAEIRAELEAKKAREQ